jgi:hypothetical protein
MGHKRKRKLLGQRVRRLDGIDGIDFVRCRICGDRYRVISEIHLSKHGIERETYIEKYALSRDELIAKAFLRCYLHRVFLSQLQRLQPHRQSLKVGLLRF